MGTWHEITVAGGEKPLRAFVAGFLAGRGSRDAVLFGHDVGVGSASLAERVHDLFAASSHHVLLAQESIAVPLVAAIREAGAAAALGIESHAAVVAAAMTFSAEVFSEDVAARVRREMRESIPPEVTLEHFEDSEERDLDARGAELYAPEHAYRYHVSGRLVGALPGILEMRRRALDLELVTVAPMTLKTGPAQGPAR